jgi:hypothetical protein
MLKQNKTSFQSFGRGGIRKLVSRTMVMAKRWEPDAHLHMQIDTCGAMRGEMIPEKGSARSQESTIYLQHSVHVRW